MNPQKDQAKSNQSPTHFMKVRRIWTYNQPHQTYQHLHGEVEMQAATFRGHTYAHTEKHNKKNGTIHNLISRLKNVERPHEKYSDDEPFSKKLETQACTSDVKTGIRKKPINQQQNSNLFSHIRGSNEAHLSAEASRYLIVPKKQRNDNLDQLKEENMILKEKMNELIIENERLKLRFKKYEQEIDQRIRSKEKQIKTKEQVLADKEKQILLRYAQLEMTQSLKQKAQETHSQVSKKIFSLSIQNHLEETIMPLQNSQLAKAFLEIKQLKLDKLQIEKKCNQKLNQYRKKNQEQIDKMKKGFTNNLKYYKELLMKISFKSGPEVKKYQEDIFETAILQTSSADQS